MKQGRHILYLLLVVSFTGCLTAAGDFNMENVRDILKGIIREKTHVDAEALEAMESVSDGAAKDLVKEMKDLMEKEEAPEGVYVEDQVKDLVTVRNLIKRLIAAKIKFTAKEAEALLHITKDAAYKFVKVQVTDKVKSGKKVDLEAVRNRLNSIITKVKAFLAKDDHSKEALTKFSKNCGKGLACNFVKDMLSFVKVTEDSSEDEEDTQDFDISGNEFTVDEIIDRTVVAKVMTLGAEMKQVIDEILLSSEGPMTVLLELILKTIK